MPFAPGVNAIAARGELRGLHAYNRAGPLAFSDDPERPAVAEALKLSSGLPYDRRALGSPRQTAAFAGDDW